MKRDGSIKHIVKFLEEKEIIRCTDPSFYVIASRKEGRKE